MNLIIQSIIAPLTQLTNSGNLNQQTIDSVSLQWYEADRRLLRTHTEHGRDIAFRLLKEGQRLHHHDVVYLDDKLAIVVVIEPSDVMVLSPKTLPEMARACYEIGNKHTPLFLDGNELLLPYDKPLFEWLAAAGFAPQRDHRRLSEQLRANSAAGVSAGHAHEHSHANDVAHHHH
ncbi:urease accessory protein UreE [Snodgrassella sp. CFCC 13594]|uniref:urease accessory protein UreE n=1 Tax=Snodgrassella sp. CFCC 13594 TaxID=1775559 RepID=UPI00082A2CAD|nr:urease accessory protein UreE [Snodgrassella sp. CFCC 13594]